jgi:hypothetical protein
LSPSTSWKTYCGEKVTAPLIFNLGARWSLVINLILSGYKIHASANLPQGRKHGTRSLKGCVGPRESHDILEKEIYFSLS